MGGRLGYSAATGLMVIVLAWFGIVALISSLIPVVAISPILLYIGMLIGAQAFQESPKSHAPAVVLALTPHLAAWGKLMIDNALGAAGTTAAAVGLDKLAQVGVLYHGLAIMGGGAILGGLVLGAIGAFVIDGAMRKAAGVRAGRRRAHVLRLHARRGDRLRADADGGVELPHRGGDPAGVREGRAGAAARRDAGARNAGARGRRLAAKARQGGRSRLRSPGDAKDASGARRAGSRRRHASPPAPTVPTPATPGTPR